MLTVLDRMVLVMLQTSVKVAETPNILLVCEVMDKRHDLSFRLTPKKMTERLSHLTEEGLIERHGHGYRLQDNGRIELERLTRRQGQFIRKFSRDAAAICPAFQPISS